MKKHFNLVLMSLLGLLIMTGACSNEAYDELPGSVSSFLAQYFPGLKIKDYTKLSDDSQIIQLSGEALHSYSTLKTNGQRSTAMALCFPRC